VKRSTASATGETRGADLRLASLHVRVGAIQLARAELETMAGRGRLDDTALLDLAEARWRTGDLAGAGDAATAHLAGGSSSALGLVIAAEAQAALGRPTEARRLATAAQERPDLDLDAIFAGQPRSNLWPPDPFDPVHVAGSSAPGQPDTRDDRSGRAGGSGSAAMPDGSAELESAREDLEHGDDTSATFRLAIVLRASPSLAAVVLDLVRELSGPAAELVRGDAYRLLGRELEADLAYRSVADALTATTADASTPDPLESETT